MREWLFAAALIGSSTTAHARLTPPLHAESWSHEARGLVRGVTIGPIESALHPGTGYGSPACARALREVRTMGGTWVSFTPFGRVWDLQSTGVSPTFEAPYRENRRAITDAIAQAHAEGLKVLLVPHLWVET